MYFPLSPLLPFPIGVLTAALSPMGGPRKKFGLGSSRAKSHGVETNFLLHFCSGGCLCGLNQARGRQEPSPSLFLPPLCVLNGPKRLNKCRPPSLIINIAVSAPSRFELNLFLPVLSKNLPLAHFGPVRFGSARFGSVRFGSGRSCRYNLILDCLILDS